MSSNKLVKLGNFHDFFFFLSSADVFQHYFFLNILSGIESKVPHSLDPDQAQHSVGPDLDSN